METASAHIESAIKQLLAAHAQACMCRGSGDSDYMAPVPELLRKAQNSIDRAISDARKRS